MTPLYRLLLPVLDNAGEPLAVNHTRFRAALMDIVGAYTVEPNVTGSWRDGSGQEISDESTPYLIGAPAGIVADVIETAHRLFPDQASIFVMKVGEFSYSEPLLSAFRPVPPATGDVVGPYLPVEQGKLLKAVATGALSMGDALDRAQTLESVSRHAGGRAWAIQTAARDVRKAQAAHDASALEAARNKLALAVAASYNEPGEVAA